MQKRSSSILAIVLTLILVLTFTFGSVHPAQAADIRNTGTLPAGETVDDDLILSGDQVQVDGTVNGMLIAAGQTVILNGTINGDAVLVGRTIIVSDKAVIKGNLFTGGQTVTVNGQVTGSIAAGSSSMILGSKVGSNVYYGGYSLETAQSSAVDRGLYFGGYQAVLKGSIARDLQASAGAVELDGPVGGSATLRVASPGQKAEPVFFGPYSAQMPPSIPTGLRIGPNATIGGKLVYTSQANQDAAIKAAPAGGIVYQTPVPTERDQRATRVNQPVVPFFNGIVNFIRNFVSLLILGLLAVWLLPIVTRGASDIVRAKPAASAGYGLLTIIVAYVGAFLTALLLLGFGLFLTILTLGGLSRVVFGLGFSSLGLAVTAFTMLVIYASKLVVAYLAGDLILAAAAPELKGRRYWAIAIGVLLYAIIRSIPILGWVIEILVVITGVGAMWLYYRSLRGPQPAPVNVTSIEPAA